MFAASGQGFADPGTDLVFRIIVVIVNTFVISYAARYMDVWDADLGRCFIISLFHMLLTAILESMFGNMGWIISAILMIILVKFILATSWLRSIMLYIAVIVIYVIIMFGLFMFCTIAPCFFCPPVR